MSFEINPVLAGKFDAPDYAAANGVTTSASTDDVSAPDPRRYTQFDRTVLDGAGSTTDFSFGDLVDMLNPLEHIPIVSSIYRAIAGETINPVARVTGDILYGGVMGVASAVLGGVGAVADTELAAQTGKDSSGLALAALFGPDDETQNPVQLADAGTAKAASVNPSATPGSQNIELVQAATTKPAQAALQIAGNAPTFTPATPSAPVSNALTLNMHTSDPLPPQTEVAAQVAEAAAAPAAASASSSTPTTAPSPPIGAASAPTTPSGTIPLLASASGSLPSAKQPFGGVMAPPHQPNMGDQDMTMALAQGAPSMRLGHTIYTNRLMNGPHPLPPMLSAGSGAPSTSGNTPILAPAYAPPPVLPTSLTTSSAASTTPGAAFASGGMSTMPPELMQDMMLKALGQYRSIAAGPSNTGGAVNLTN